MYIRLSIPGGSSFYQSKSFVAYRKFVKKGKSKKGKSITYLRRAESLSTWGVIWDFAVLQLGNSYENNHSDENNRSDETFHFECPPPVFNLTNALSAEILVSTSVLPLL